MENYNVLCGSFNVAKLSLVAIEEDLILLIKVFRKYLWFFLGFVQIQSYENQVYIK